MEYIANFRYVNVIWIFEFFCSITLMCYMINTSEIVSFMWREYRHKNLFGKFIGRKFLWLLSIAIKDNTSKKHKPKWGLVPVDGDSKKLETVRIIHSRRRANPRIQRTCFQSWFIRKIPSMGSDSSFLIRRPI